jgi:glycosyltransferase involved in cell wall biosynthesis
MLMASKAFSIILPTYSGADTIGDTLSSIANQTKVIDFELIIIQDGPQPAVEASVRQALKNNKLNEFANYKVLPKNIGRFEARFTGAKLAKTRQLLFIDDRVELSPDFFKKLVKLNKPAMMGNVIEKIDQSTNLISETLYRIRRLVYGSKSGSDFKDYYIDKANFESSPKGTASLYVNKQLFIEACESIIATKVGIDSRYFNDDTGLIRYIVDHGQPIYRSSSIKIYYLPRKSFLEAFWHLYNRGPLFVDYYLRPGSKFFPLLMIIYLTLWITLILAFWEPKVILGLLIIGLSIDLWATLKLSHKPRTITKTMIGLPLVLSIFTLGVIKGSLIKLGVSARRKRDA